MKKICILSALFIFTVLAVIAQTGSNPVKNKKNRHPDTLFVPSFSDSVVATAHTSYDQVNGIHRWLFGENYRKEWALPSKLPVIRLSSFHGGLSPVKQGGGMESKSLRLIDSSGQEWVLRSVEKTPDKLLSENLQGTFAVDWVGDEFSGQHPYAALIVPPLAQAAHVPHANPVIGVIADDPALGTYRFQFAGTVCLLEEREPTGNSINTQDMEKAMISSSDNRIDGSLFLRARMLDLLIGDWDRHEDQWRWAGKKKDKSEIYEAVPRDRDQVFHVTEGLFPSIASLPWLDPVLENFSGDIPKVKYSLFKTRFLRAFPDTQLNYTDWVKAADDFVKAETDEVLEAGLRRLPKESYEFRHDALLAKLKRRRDHIPAAMASYYRFINRIVDIRTTDKPELITVTDAPAQGMQVMIQKLNKEGQVKGSLWDLVYDPAVTKEVRLYVQGGNDQIKINTSVTPVRLRIIDSAGNKYLDVRHASRVIRLYGPKDSINLVGDASRVRTRLSAYGSASRFVPVDLYNIWAPQATAAINADDGFLLGFGFKYTGHDGFRKLPYSTVQQLMITHSFETNAFRLHYGGEWIQAIGKADVTAEADIQAPDNTMNFFGRGDETVLDKSGDYHRFYRARFDVYNLSPALRWHTGTAATLSAGPAFQFYHLDASDNTGRLISQSNNINAYDAKIVDKDKAHGGIIVNYVSNQRNNNMLPVSGYYFNIKAEGYKGLNSYSRSFAQLRPEFTYYQKIDSAGRIVLSDRIGGGVTVGSPAFYQSMFLGGQGNLLGYLQNRFAGQDMVFNNFQGRLKLADIAGYILPGQFGITGFYDVGRVWVSDEHSDKWHQGTGGGLYFSPASLAVVQVLAGHSEEGWYPYISLNFRL